MGKMKKNSHDWDVLFIVCLDSSWLLFATHKYEQTIQSHVKGTLVEEKEQNLISSQNSVQYTSETIARFWSPFFINLCASLAYFI